MSEGTSEFGVGGTEGGDGASLGKGGAGGGGKGRGGQEGKGGLGRRLLRWAGVVMVGVVGVAVYDGVRRENAGAGVVVVRDPPAGTTAEVASTGPATRAVARRAGDVLRVATFNIAGGRGLDRVEDLERTSKAIGLAALAGVGGGVDFVGLQEVRSGWLGEGSGGGLGGAGANQAEVLAGELTMKYAFSASERRWWREHFGNGLLTVKPVESVIRIPLPQTQERGQRNATMARVRHQGRIVTVVVTHIDRRVDQPAQLRFVVDLFAGIEGPAVLMGDMNVTRNHPTLRELVEKHGAVDATAGFVDGTLRGGGAGGAGRIDLIFVKGFVPVDAGTVEIGASDHPLVWADLRLVGGAP